MATSYSPLTVTSGLVMYLDAANPKSYPGSGTAWTDISRNNNNATLTNGPTFNSANSGNIVFDGVDDYLLTASISSFRSISMFVYKTEVGPSGWKYLLDARPGMGGGYFANLSTGDWTNWYLNGSSIASTYSLLPTNQWFHLYIQAPTTYTSTINFMSRYSNNEQMGGKLGIIQIYNRTLSAQEIAQNYNATKTRYGL